MKKKLIEVVQVSELFQLLSRTHFNNFTTSYAIAKAVKEINGHKEFYISEEKKIVEAYASKDKDGQVIVMDGNRIKFDNMENAQKFNSEISNLQKTEIDIFEPIELKLSDFKDGDMNLTPNDIMALDGFIVFNDNVKLKEA